jgi:hypothetical protein
VCAHIAVKGSSACENCAAMNSAGPFSIAVHNKG